MFFLTKSIGLYLNVLSYTHPKKASLLAYRLFSEPRVGRLQKENLPKILQEAQTDTFRHGDHDMQYYKWPGNEHVILLVHGWESNASRWERMLPHLQQSGSTIIAIDAPAHGLSSGKEFNIPKYAEFIDAAVQQFKPDALIGHSIGGAACVYYQSHFPDNGIKKMVLLGAPSDLETLVRNYVNLLSLNNNMVRLLENHFMERFAFRTAEFSGKIFGSKLHLKGIIAHDIDDEIVAFDEAKKIAGSWKHATFIETNGLGHSMHDAILYEKVVAFLFED